jgi:dTDP-4-amino-4,6-dideoxygalactose transaminase
MPGQNDFIPFHNLTRQYHSISGELMHEMDLVMQSGDMLNGYRLASFEDNIAARCGREYAIAVNSGTNAINYVLDLIQRERELSLKSKEIGVAIPNFSFRSTRNCVAGRGTIIPIDVRQDNGLMDFSSMFSHQPIDVLMYVNLYGNMINYEELITVVRLFIDNPNAVIIEDACQSFGSTYKGQQSGSFGKYSVFSFDPTKNLGHAGGGMILTDDHASAAWLWEYVRNGQSIGADRKVNSTIDEINAAALLVKLKYFDQWQERRKAIAEFYSENLDKSIITPDMTTTKGVEHNWHKYVIMSDRRDTIMAHLKEKNIETKVHYVMDINTMIVVPEFDSLGARIMSNNVLSLPMYPELTDAEVETIVEEINYAVNSPPMLNPLDVKINDDWPDPNKI